MFFLLGAALLSVTMDGQPAVVFRNVGQLYFPQTRLECHYSLGPGHQWSSSDWIGIFEVHTPVSSERSIVYILSRNIEYFQFKLQHSTLSLPPELASELQ